MNDQAIAGIRTLVPLVVGVIVTWAASRGVEVDDETRAALAGLVTAVAAFAYWGIVTLVSRRWPQAQVLLGVGTPPTYQTDTSGPELDGSDFGDDFGDEPPPSNHSGEKPDQWEQ